MPRGYGGQEPLPQRELERIARQFIKAKVKDQTLAFALANDIVKEQYRGASEQFYEEQTHRIVIEFAKQLGKRK